MSVSTSRLQFLQSNLQKISDPNRDNSYECQNCGGFWDWDDPEKQTVICLWCIDTWREKYCAVPVITRGNRE